MTMFERWQKSPMLSGGGKTVWLKKHTNARKIKGLIKMFKGSVIKNHEGKILYDGRNK